ncbi:MAG: hypothetical protein HW390_1331 [Candidatus Brocadiaceae bacterium]|nr:hypothetical protein [Candidatus Brocadiaceae bacterium]
MADVLTHVKPEMIVQHLDQLLLEGTLGRGNGPRVKKLKELFKYNAVQPFAATLNALWEGDEVKAAAAAFRNFKKDLNERFEAAGIPLRLVHHQDNRSINDKQVWFDEMAPADRKMALEKETQDIRKTTRTIETHQKTYYADTPAAQYIPQQVLTDIPVVRFPADLESFAQRMATEQWKALTSDQQNYLKNVSVKLEPIIQIAPATPIPYILGFELLGLGPNGESFPSITAKVPEDAFDPALVRFLLALAGLKTAETLRSCACIEGHPGARNLMFTINLDACMIESKHLETFLHACKNLLENVIFEINEETKTRHIARIKEIMLKFDLRFALDDINDLDNDLDTEVRKVLEKRAELSKLDFKTFKKSMENVWDNADEAVKLISTFRIDGKPLVVEGLKDKTEQGFLENKWKQGKLGHLYGQGFNVDPGKPWEAWLSDLKNFGLPGGHILSSPLLAKANRIITEFLGAEAHTLSRENRGDIFVFKFTVKDHREITMGLVSENTPGISVEQADALSIDYFIVKEKLPLSFAGRSPRKTNIEQITLDELPRFLPLFNEMESRALEMLNDGYKEFYPVGYHVKQHVEVPDNSAISSDAPPEEGISFLENWLDKTKIPFCIILGDYGIGKTFLSRMFTRHILEKRKANQHLPVPLYLDMRHLPSEPRVPDLDDMLRALIKKAGFKDISIEGIKSAVHQGHIFVIFDGFDEKAGALTEVEAKELLNNIRSLIPADKEGKLLLSSRTHYFLNQSDENKKIVEGASTGTRDGYDKGDFLFVYLQPFDETRIKQYLENVFPGKSEEIFDFLKTLHDLTDLIKRPYLLFLISKHLDELRGLEKQGMRIGVADIYEMSIQEWSDRDADKLPIFSKHKVGFMQELARNLWEQGKQEIFHEPLQKWLFAQIEKEGIPRLDWEELFRADSSLRTGTFLIRDHKGNYRFAHKSFLEFFLARHISAGLSAQTPDVLQLPRLSKEILAFACELIHKPAYNLAHCRLVIKDVLESPYKPLISENALLLKVAWDRLHQESAPQLSCIRLEGADFADADLAGVRLTSVHLSRAKLAGVDLTGAVVSGDLSSINLTHARATGITLEGSSLCGASLDVADFSGANLKNVDLSHAKGVSASFTRADFSGARLGNASFPYARLRMSNISKSQLKQADVSRASLPDVTLGNLKIALQSGHAASVHSVHFSPDGALIASGSGDNTVKLWEVKTGKEIMTLSGHNDSVNSVHFSPDGALIASGSGDKTVKLWEVKTGKELFTLSGHTSSVVQCKFQSGWEAHSLWERG